ncbi:MAG: hypothetical protein M3256_19015 [Actinomycetota bacterium]|nr:hypothetical protein [Actinomycetota bacterium]
MFDNVEVARLIRSTSSPRVSRAFGAQPAHVVASTPTAIIGVLSSARQSHRTRVDYRAPKVWSGVNKSSAD